eukprot:CAMPEP_0167766326 /NCGR_PEP_ID=MMETSP0110_2-20121227/15273_1 /TAXON_ID=629695 /ORGANISM="Gymnochlora sp., Strain CCMP2014" /LENGTH=67 /DNA_ID=CAMNT_0007654323 /DNA_START=332 /DNA_END=532 /DNA_ORIENTATION=-
MVLIRDPNIFDKRLKIRNKGPAERMVEINVPIHVAHTPKLESAQSMRGKFWKKPGDDAEQWEQIPKN